MRCRFIIHQFFRNGGSNPPPYIIRVVEGADPYVPVILHFRVVVGADPYRFYLLSIIYYLLSLISFLPSPTSYGSPRTPTPTFFQVLQGTCTPCKAEVRRRSGSFLLFFRRILRRCPEWHTLPLCHGIRLWLCIQVFRLPTFHAS